MNRFFILARLFIADPQTFWVVWRVKRQKLSYKSFQALAELSKIVRWLRRQDVEGAYIEAGCALGGSALVLSAAKEKSTPFHLYDTFEMIPPPSDKDGADVHERYEEITQGHAVGIKGDTYYGYQRNLFEQVKGSFATFDLHVEKNNVVMHKGLFEDTLQVDGPVALAHLDCDWYESVMVCLERIVPNLEVGGVLIIDDYYDWSGCKQAIDEYFADKQDAFRFETDSQLLIWREK